uniref:Uncharacterized protein n=1 Tax=Parascaris univalens TaxID=6257 RepID=A0A915BPU7_PARUN
MNVQLMQRGISVRSLSFLTIFLPSSFSRLFILARDVCFFFFLFRQFSHLFCTFSVVPCEFFMRPTINTF